MRFSRKVRWILYSTCMFIFLNAITFYTLTKRDEERAVVSFTRKVSFPKSAFARIIQTYKTSNTRKIPHHQVLSRHKITDIRVVAGRTRKDKVFLVIGIPTSYRHYAHYLTDTLLQLVKGLNENEKNEVLINVFATDFQQNLREDVISKIVKNFKNELDSGLINVIQFPANIYPSLTDIPKLWNDSPERIRWRSKQSLDYAFSFHYCSSLGNFYLQLEDDISVDPGYLKVIKSFIALNKNRNWSVLEFGARGFIGMLYRTSHLKRLSLFVRMYYWIWPVDVLFRQFNDFNLYGNPSFARLKKPLFHHVGAYSSLKGQARKLEDLQKRSRLYMDADNPRASVFTTITHYAGASITETYSKNKNGVFWGQNVKVQDNVTIVFAKPENIERIIIETGGANAPEDIIGEATLFISFSNKKEKECKTFKKWERYKNVAKLTARLTGQQEGKLLKCIRLTVTKLRLDKNGRARWLRIREIAVWVKK